MKRFAFVLLAALLVAATLTVCLTHQSGWAQDRDAISAPVSRAHWAGTDDLGRDRATRLAMALLLGSVGALLVASASTAVAVAVALGTVFGPAWLRCALRYGSDAFLTLPWLFLLMLARSILPLTLSAVACSGLTLFLLACLGWPMHVRGLCARLQTTRDAAWFLQAHASGLSPVRIAFHQVLPHLRVIYTTQFLVCIPLCILAEADLGTIGFGMSEPLVSWGTLLQEVSSSSQATATHWAFAPLALLMLILLCFEFLIVED